MTQLKRQRRLSRVPDAFLPAALAAASLLRPANRSALELYVAWLLVCALSLFTSRGVRIAFARQPAIRHVRGSVKCALLATLIGGGVAVAALKLFFRDISPDPLPLIVSGVLLNIEHIFYEYMYAIGDDRSATLSRGLTALFTLAGLLLYEGGQTFHPFFLVGMTGLAALVSVVISLVMGDGAKGRLDAAVLRCAPWAALQTLLYPAATAALVFICHFGRYSFAFFAGLTLYELCKTPFRRSMIESRSFNKALLIACGAAGLVWLAAGLLVKPAGSVDSAWLNVLNELPTACIMVLAAAACAFALFGRLPRKANEYE